jgi:hypothetical protein
VVLDWIAYQRVNVPDPDPRTSAWKIASPTVAEVVAATPATSLVVRLIRLPWAWAAYRKIPSKIALKLVPVDV